MKPGLLSSLALGRAQVPQSLSAAQGGQKEGSSPALFNTGVRNHSSKMEYVRFTHMEILHNTFFKPLAVFVEGY